MQRMWPKATKTTPAATTPATRASLSKYSTAFHLFGSSIPLSSRKDLSIAAQKRIIKHTFGVVCAGEKEYQHEIANHYRDYQQLTLKRATAKGAATAIESTSSLGKRKRRRKCIEMRSHNIQRELYQIPCFVFPRYTQTRRQQNKILHVL